MIDLSLEEKEQVIETLATRAKMYKHPLWLTVFQKPRYTEDGFSPYWPILYSRGYLFDYELRPYYDWMLKHQGGVCAICGQYRIKATWNRMHVDHDHATHEIRGVLCGWCNVMLGLAGDNVAFYLNDDCERNPFKILYSAIKYLTTNRTGYPVYTKAFKDTDCCEKWRDNISHLCEICGNSEARKRLAVDHDHYTGIVRGLLCTRCNLMLGNAEDSVDVLKKAIHYLKYAPCW